MAAVVSNKDTWVNMASKLKAMGGVREAGVGELTTGIQSGMVMIIPASMRVDETTLGHPREIHTVTLRRFESRAKGTNAAEVDFALDQWRANVQRDIFGDFDLGGTMGYALPTQFAAEWGYQTIESTLYRILDLTVAYRVDDRATFAP